MPGYTSGLVALKYNIVNFIEPHPINYKVIRNFNTTSSNLSHKMRLSQVLKLDGYSQQVNRISRICGRTQFGNFYLGQPLNMNYLGRVEGMSGGSGKPPTNF